MEVDSEIKPAQIESVQNLLNERLCGLTFKEIRTTLSERFRDVEEDQRPVIRLFVDSVDKIFTLVNSKDNVYLTGQVI